MQPINTQNLKKQSLQRWEQFPIVLAQEIENLKEGIKQGYTVSIPMINENACNLSTRRSKYIS